MALSKKEARFKICLEYLANAYDFQFNPLIPANYYKHKNEEKYFLLNLYDFNTIWCELIMVEDIDVPQKDLQRAIDILSLLVYGNINITPRLK